MNAQDRLEFEKLRDILIEQGRTQSRSEEKLLNIYHLSEKMESHLDKSNGRLRKVENRFWYISGGLAVALALGGVALALVF